MSAILIKSQSALEITQNPAIAAWQRGPQALKALSGLTLTELSEATQAGVEVQLVAVNQIISGYDIESEADYENLSDTDAAEILRCINKVSQLCIASETERVMQALAKADRKLPVAAINEVREHRNLFVPLLIKSLQQAIVKTRDGDELQEDASFFAAFLLTELEVDEALPTLLDALRLPGEGPLDLLSDAIHELAPRALALFSRGNTDTIADVVGDPDLNLYVRWSATQAYKLLIRDGVISRSSAVDALLRHFQHSVENDDNDLLAPLACELADLAAESALETIRSAYERQLVDDEIVSLKFIESQIAAGEETISETMALCRPTGIPDTIEELSRWASFQEEPQDPSTSQTSGQTTGPMTPPPRDPDSLSLASDDDRPPPVTTIRVDARVGRNEPCPCGSGKKFKKCCR